MGALNIAPHVTVYSSGADLLPGFTPYRDREVRFGARVEVYRNLNEQRRSGRVRWSIRHAGRVVGHADAVSLQDARLHTNPPAAARIAAGQARTVHAWVSGILVPYVPADEHCALITYRPHRGPDFYDVLTGAALDPQTAIDTVTFDADRMWASR